MAARRAISIILAAVLLFGLSWGALALPNEDYSLTGNEAEDIVTVASAQKGKRIDDFGWTVDWCAYFVCWAGARVGADFPNIGTVRGMALWFLNEQKGDFYCLREENYESLIALGLQDKDAPIRTTHDAFTPRKGDLVCYRWEGSSSDWSHIGIVTEDYDGSGYIHTVEGNTRINGVYQVAEMRRSYDGEVVGFIRPNYRVKTPPVDDRPGFTLTPGEVTLGLGDEGGAVLYATPSGKLPEQLGYEVSLDRPELADVFPRREGDGLAVALFGRTEGSGTLTVRMIDAESGAQLASRTAQITVQGGTYTVRYDSNGGTGAPRSQTQNRGQPLMLSAQIPARPGYEFVGWAERATADTPRYQPGGTYTAGRDITLYAVWRRAQAGYTVRHYQQGLPGETEYRLIEEEHLSAYVGEGVSPPVRNYIGFTSPEVQTATVAAGGETVISYYYVRNRYSLKLESGEGISGISGGGDYYYGERVPLTAELKKGYRFAGWYRDGALLDGQSGAELTMPAKDVALEARAARDTAAGGCPFGDAEEHWAREAICYVWERDLFRGTSEEAFSPDAQMNRAMVVTVLYRLSGAKAPEHPPSFADVPEDAWYADAVGWAAAEGIVTGTGAGFDPEGAVTREQLATILYRYADGSPEGTLDGFPDRGEVSPWAVEALSWATEYALIRGRPDGSLDPQGTATRAEVATILMRYLEQMNG